MSNNENDIFMLIDDDNSIYEIDNECMKRKQNGEADCLHNCKDRDDADQRNISGKDEKKINVSTDHKSRSDTGRFPYKR